MQNNGSNKAFFLRSSLGIFLCCISLPILFIGIWWLGAIPSHIVAMHTFERAFADLDHPDSALFVHQYTYFGMEPSYGNSSDGCYYAIAEVRTLPQSLEYIERYYNEEANISGALMGSEITILPVSQAPYPMPWNSFVSGVMGEMLNTNNDVHAGMYLLYVQKSDPNMFGDFRCWVL